MDSIGLGSLLGGHLFLTLLVLAAGPSLSARETVFTNACYSGVVAAQKVLPRNPDQDSMTTRGYASCNGAVLRMRETGELSKEPNVVTSGCAYAVGATFAKYGFVEETTPSKLSGRAVKALGACVAAMAHQGLKDPLPTEVVSATPSVSYSSAAGGFAAQFPCLPLETERDQSVGDAKVHVREVQCETADGEYFALLWFRRLPGDRLSARARAIAVLNGSLDGAKSALTDPRGLQLESMAEGSWDGVLSQEARASISEGPERATAVLRVVVVGDRIVELTAITRDGSATAAKFIESAHLTVR